MTPLWQFVSISCSPSTVIILNYGTVSLSTCIPRYTHVSCIVEYTGSRFVSNVRHDKVVGLISYNCFLLLNWLIDLSAVIKTIIEFFCMRVCAPKYRRVYQKRAKRETFVCEYWVGGGVGNDMTESLWWGESGKLRTQLIGHEQQLLPWPRLHSA